MAGMQLDSLKLNRVEVSHQGGEEVPAINQIPLLPLKHAEKMDIPVKNEKNLPYVGKPQAGLLASTPTRTLAARNADLDVEEARSNNFYTHLPDNVLEMIGPLRENSKGKMLQSSNKEISDKLKVILDIQNAQRMFNLQNLHERGMILIQKKNAKLAQHSPPKYGRPSLEGGESALENDNPPKSTSHR